MRLNNCNRNDFNRILVVDIGQTTLNDTWFIQDLLILFFFILDPHAVGLATVLVRCQLNWVSVVFICADTELLLDDWMMWNLSLFACLFQRLIKVGRIGIRDHKLRERELLLVQICLGLLRSNIFLYRFEGQRLFLNLNRRILQLLLFFLQGISPFKVTAYLV